MTNNARPRHAAQGRASRIAGRTALGVLGAPIAMLAVAGPAGAATLDLDGVLGEDSLDLELAADGLAVPGLDALGVAGLPTELPTELPLDGVAFEGVSLDLLDLGGDEGLALPELPELPGVDSLPVAGALAAVPVALPELPSVDDLAVPIALPELPGTDALPELPALPDAVGTVTGLAGSLPVALPELPGTDALPELPALPDAVGTVTGLAGGLPLSSNLDLDDVSVDELPAAADVFSATDLVSGLI